MLILVASLLLGFAALTQGPSLFASIIATASAAVLRRQIDRSGTRLTELRGVTLSRYVDGEGWDCVRSEQRLLDRSLRMALRQTSLMSQYPVSAVRAYAAV